MSSAVSGPIVSLDESIEWLCDALRQVRLSGGTVHLIGNGGSASVVAHVQNDLVKACGIRAMVHQDVPLLTAYANDRGYQHGYANALALWVGSRDVLIAVSSSGESQNIWNSAELANNAGATVVTFTGFLPKNTLREMGHLNFYVPSSNYGHVELTHAALLHCLTDRLAHAG
jgi:D-sedoheptulose 7-phosphate isomerase